MVQLAVAQLAGAAVNCDGLAAALMATVALPALLTVTVTGKVALLPTPTLPKSRLDGDTATDALVEELTPEPLRETVCGLSAALSVMVTVPVRVPVVEGVKLTLIVQLAAAATEPLQLPVPAKAKSPVLI